jgi:hypothetical protein
VTEAAEHPLVAARRRAEAYHVLYIIDHDGSAFVGTVGEPDPRGVGTDGRAYHAPTCDELLHDLAAEYDRTFGGMVGAPRPAMKLDYTDAARKAMRGAA